MALSNTTFSGGNPTWANACVGENGFPGYWEYAKGFSQAAAILIDTALQRQGLEHSVDELVYPVCFNMRHSVELRLKGAISELIAIQDYRSISLKFDLAGSHDIGNIWNFFVENSRIIDDRFEPIIKQLDKKIGDIAEIDPTGQTFRYPYNTESQKHLVDVGVINLFVLKGSFSFLESAMDKLHRLNKYLCEEYKAGTFTKKLSRKNIFELATHLPPRHTWSDAPFATTRVMLKAKYNIGSKELSEAINIIKAHYELAPLIEISIPLLGVNDEDIDDFFCHWFKQNKLPSDTDPINFDGHIDMSSFDIIEYMEKQSKNQKAVWDIVSQNLTPERLAGLTSLFNFAYYLGFSELYEQMFKSDLQEAKTIFNNSRIEVKSKYFHISEKTNAIEHILQSLYFLRKNELANRLVKKYSIESKFSWLDDARNRSLFKKRDYCDYT